LRWIYDRREIAEVRRDLAAWLNKRNAKYARLCDWVEENIEETLTYYRLPLSHHKHEIDQHAGAVEPGDQTPHACCADLPQPSELPAVGAGPGG
jgi:hypothetical protein